MTFFPITNEDKAHLKRLNDNKPVIFSLKKLFLNSATKSKLPADVNVLASERVAIDIIDDTFRQLENIQPSANIGDNKENVI